MPLPTIRQIAELARGGATVVFEALPADVPGYGTLDERRRGLQSVLAAWTFAPGPVAGVERAAAGSGSVLRGDVLGALGAAGTLREPLAGTPVDFIRRRTSAGYDYFLANLTGDSFAGRVALGVDVTSATITDPLTGRAGAVAIGRDSRLVHLELKPGQSLLVSTATRPGAAGAQPWNWLEPAGAALTIDGTWTIEFVKGGPELPPPLTTTRLASWTELGGEDARRFGGTARYRIEFQAPDGSADDWLLDLGDVRESARVRLNGRDVATAWSLPFELYAGDALRRGRNVLELEVTNLAANRIRDMDRRGVAWKIMRDTNIVNIRYQPFDASSWPLEASGLLGPVRLVPMRRSGA
jgi:hypothetical protein